MEKIALGLVAGVVASAVVGFVAIYSSTRTGTQLTSQNQVAEALHYLV